MDTGIVFSLILAVVFLGGIFWLVIYSRKESEKHTAETDLKLPKSESKDRAA